MSEAGQGLTGWVLEPDADPATGVRVVVPGTTGGEPAFVAAEDLRKG